MVFHYIFEESERVARVTKCSEECELFLPSSGDTAVSNNVGSSAISAAVAASSALTSSSSTFPFGKAPLLISSSSTEAVVSIE